MAARSDMVACADGAVENSTGPGPRRHHRFAIRTLTYVNMDAGNGGVLRDISESGLAVQAAAPVSRNQELHVRFELTNPRARFDVDGKVVWTDCLGQAGVEFVALPVRSRRSLRDWLFTQALANAHRTLSGPDDAEAGLLFSASARPAIRLARRPHADDRNSNHPQLVRLLGWAVSPRTLASIVDGLALLCAVLLFAVISLLSANYLPDWPALLALASGVSIAFAALYWLVFMLGMGHTPGQKMAKVALSNAVEREPGEYDRVRFR